MPRLRCAKGKVQRGEVEEVPSCDKCETNATKMPRVSDLIATLRDAGYSDYMQSVAVELIDGLTQYGVYGVGRFIRRLISAARSSSDYQNYLDIMVEGRFALLLAKRGFSAVQLEYSTNGPDISANWSRNAIYFEVKRTRPREDDSRIQNSVIWKGHDGPNVIGMIQQKMRQLRENERNVIVLWSDTVNLMIDDMDKAFSYIRQHISRDSNAYRKLGGILFKGGGYSFSPLRQFYLFENSKALKPLGTRLCAKLRNLFEQNPRELVDENEALGRELRRMSNPS